MSKLVLAGVFLVFVLAFFLRVMFLPKNSLTFGYDQARDAIVAQQIIKGDIKIQGPPASTQGLYHGVFYYYVLAPAYLLGKGSPIAAAYWIAFLNASVVFVVFYLTYLLTRKNIFTSILASLLFAISFEATQYATWLSNPTIAILTVPLLYLGLWGWIREGKKWGPLLTGIGLGLSIQSEIFLAYHIVPIAIWLFVSRKNITKKQVLTFLMFLGIALSTMIVSEFKFGFRGLEGIKSLAVSAEVSLAYAKSIGDYLTLYLNQTGRIFAFNSYPGNIGYGGAFVFVLAVVSLLQLKKSKENISPEAFLAVWLFSHLTVVTVGGTSTPFLMVGIGPAVSMLIALYVTRLWKNYKFIAAALIVILIYGNMSMILRENKSGSTLFSIQKDMLLSKELSAVDYTYEKASGKPFSTNSLTSPLWINLVWTYLYKWYGQPKYGYVPSWHGKDQIGLIDSLGQTRDDTKTYFLIIEPLAGIPPRYLDETVGEEDTKSRLLEDKAFGEIRVQYREKLVK